LNEFRTKIVATKEAIPKSNATLEANLSPEKKVAIAPTKSKSNIVVTSIM
jgi:hypothetical protein